MALFSAYDRIGESELYDITSGDNTRRPHEDLMQTGRTIDSDQVYHSGPEGEEGFGGGMMGTGTGEGEEVTFRTDVAQATGEVFNKNS